MGNALVGWLGLGFCLFCAALCVFFNIVLWDNVVPQVIGPSVAQFGWSQGGIASQEGTVIMLGQWSRMVLPGFLVLCGIAIWYFECVSKGDSQQ